MITQADALRIDTVPRKIVRRDSQMNQLANALQPVVDGGRPETTFLFGPSGAGKTSLARHGVQKLKAEVLDIDTAYVECWGRSRAAVFRRIIDQVETGYSHESDGADAHLRDLRERDRHCIAILDEADQLDDYAAIHDLYELPNVTIIGIANREPELYAKLDERIGSRVSSAVSITFDTYTHDELTAILEDRADWGLAPNAVSRSTLASIASAAGGDARLAISILRAAAKHATTAGRDRITESMVDEYAIDDAESRLQELTLAKLSSDHRRLYQAMLGEGEMTVGEVYDAYRAEVDDDVTDRYIRDLRKKLVDYGRVEKLGNKQNRRYRAVDKPS